GWHARYGPDSSLARVNVHSGAFEIDQQPALDDVEKLIVVIVFVPVILALDDSYPHHRRVHLAQRLVEPLVWTRVGDSFFVDDLERLELYVELGDIGIIGRITHVHPF